MHSKQVALHNSGVRAHRRSIVPVPQNRRVSSPPSEFAIVREAVEPRAMINFEGEVGQKGTEHIVCSVNVLLSACCGLVDACVSRTRSGPLSLSQGLIE